MTATHGMTVSWRPEDQGLNPPPVLMITGSSFIAQGITFTNATGHVYSELPALRINGVGKLELNSVVFARRPAVDTGGLVENHGHGELRIQLLAALLLCMTTLTLSCVFPCILVVLWPILMVLSIAALSTVALEVIDVVDLTMKGEYQGRRVPDLKDNKK